MIKSVPTAAFCLALVCFALPWHGLAIGDTTFGSVTGVHLVTGMTVSEKGIFGIQTKRKVDVEPSAVLSFLAILGGAASGFVKGRKGHIGSTAAGAAAVLLLATLWWKLGRESEAIVESGMRYGFCLTLLLSAVATGLALHALWRVRETGEGGDPVVRCACGANVPAGSRFCGSCGKPVA